MFVKQMEVGSMAVFAYLVACKITNEALVIDPAAETERIFKEAKNRGYRIKYIVNTHSHIDHIMGNRRMKDLTGAEIVIHEKDAMALIHQSPSMLEMFRAEPSPPADITVRDKDLITIGETSLQVIHTPGHSPGGICLYLDGMVFTGDTLFVGAVGRTDFPGCSWEALESSIRNKLYTLPGETVVFPGHNYGTRPTSTIQQEKRHNAYVRG